MINYKDIDANFTEIIQDAEPEKWVDLRRTGIGGSDAGAIMGFNKYSSPLVIYMQKKGITGFTGNAATEWGHILEDPIRQKAAKELNVEIATVPGMYRSKVYDFMNANVDGLVYAENPVELNGDSVCGLGGHEIKTSAHGDGFSDTEIPDSYFCQVQHYMAVTNLDWFILTVFILDRKIGKHYIIKRNDEFIGKLIEAETDFWENYVMADKMPEPIGVDSETDYIRELPMNSVIQLDDDCLELITQEKELDAQIKELKQKQDALKNSILLKLVEHSDGTENADKVTAIVGSYKVTYNNQIRKSLDTEALKKDGLYDRYAKETVSKVMRISGGK